MADVPYPMAPETAAQWEEENEGFLTALSTAHAENDAYVVEDLLERLAPAPDEQDETVRQRERTLGDIKVVELEVRDPVTHKLSSTSGPAVVKHDGTRLWFYAGLQHNANGPAVIRPNGEVEYHYLGAKCRDAEDLDAMVRRAQRHARNSKNWLNASPKGDDGSGF